MNDQNSNQPLTKTQRRELRKQEIAQQRQGQQRRSNLWIWAIVLAGVLVIGGLVYWVATGSDNPGTPVTGAADAPVLGGTDAKVVVSEFSDLSCPACAAAVPVIRQLADIYGDQIKIEFRSFPIGHQWSEKSLEAGRCALAQGQFWEYAEVVFAKQADWETASNAVDLFKSYAKDVGLDPSQFDSCLDSGQTASAIQEDVKLGRDRGVSATPTFFINDQKIVGVQSIDQFKNTIDGELSKIN
ncbi:MAG: thioredoxin domain-containing protein [Patescibacteria group bacterium]